MCYLVKNILSKLSNVYPANPATPVYLSTVDNLFQFQANQIPPLKEVPSYPKPAIAGFPDITPALVKS